MISNFHVLIPNKIDTEQEAIEVVEKIVKQFPKSKNMITAYEDDSKYGVGMFPDGLMERQEGGQSLAYHIARWVRDNVQ